MTDDMMRVDGRRPIMALLDLLSQRWALRLLWELRDTPRNSRDLREAMTISPTVLQTRLDELRSAGIVEHAKGSGYRLTALGGDLIAAFAPLYAFASRWSVRLANENSAERGT
jgi:DNA-binding HxlR family transcriptional regulator